MIKQNDLSQQLYLLKNTKALNLKRYRYVPRVKEENALYSFKGLSSDRFSDKWFLIANRQSIFKTFDDPLYPEIRDKRILNEMLCFRLADKLGIKAAPCQAAKYGEYDGIVSYSFLKDGDTMINADKILYEFDGSLMHQNAFDNFMVALPIYAGKDGALLDDDIELDLFKMLVFDFLTIQEDRHLGNVVFIKNEDGRLRLAPLFDNEFAFSIVAKSGDDEFTLDSAHKNSTRMKAFAGNKKTVPAEAAEIFALSHRDESFRKFLNKVVSFNIDEFFEEFDGEISIDEEYKNYCKECFEYGQNALKEAIRKQEISDLVDELIKGEDESENEI